LRFADLKGFGIVHNWPTLLRWIEKNGFPPGRHIGQNTRAGTEAEVDEWINSRPTARKNGEAA
jgi:predicted DNA-binding transcriptional regulator AlpA